MSALIAKVRGTMYKQRHIGPQIVVVDTCTNWLSREYFSAKIEAYFDQKFEREVAGYLLKPPWKSK